MTIQPLTFDELFEQNNTPKHREMRERRRRAAQINNPPQTWNEIVAIEPKLATLLKEAQAYKPTSDFCANDIWYGYGKRKGGLKHRVEKLVGWWCDNDLLATEEAYDVAYSKIFDALPNCQHKSVFC